jgi:hypothetical protein
MPAKYKYAASNSTTANTTTGPSAETVNFDTSNSLNATGASNTANTNVNTK